MTATANTTVGFGGLGENYHCDECDITVHAHDMENHINGAKHRYRVRINSESKLETKKANPEFRCATCNTDFTNMHFFTIHQGSKTHKRNLRKTQRKLEKGLPEGTVKLELPPIKPVGFRPLPRKAPVKTFNDDLIVPLENYMEGSDYKSIREKYRPRNMKNPEGYNKAYICSVAAYWAICLALDTSVKDFKICLNDKEFGDFGDAVVQVEFNDSDNHGNFVTTFAIQFKDICSNVKHIDTLGEGRFAFSKFITQVKNIRRDKTPDTVSDDYTKFVVFTTALPGATMDKQIRIKTDLLHKSRHECSCGSKETSAVAKTLSNRKKLIINTSDDNDNIYFFFCTDNIHSLPRIYLYTHQSKQRHFGMEIDEVVSELLYGDPKVHIHKDFVKYIENWSDGLLGGSYKLNKEDVLVKLSHLLLSDFRVDPQARGHQARAVDYHLWHQAVSSVDVTVFSKHPAAGPNICDPLNQKVELELELKIDTSTRSIDLGQNTIQRIKNPVLKMYLFEETLGELHDHVPLSVVYDFFWKAGLTPLPLEVKDLKEQHRVLDIVSLVKSFGVTRRYFLITPVDDIKSSLRYHVKTLSFFVNLSDIAAKMPSSFLDQVKINVTENFCLSLGEIQKSDEFFLKSVTAQEFYDMSLGNYSFKCFSYGLARCYGNVTQLVLDDELLRLLKEEVESKEETKRPFPYATSWEATSNKGHGGKHKTLKGIRPNLFS